jgi:hypothetical protein
MNFRSSISVLLVALGATALVSIATPQLTGNCARLADAEFESDFTYMTSTSEGCNNQRYACSLNLPTWRQEIVLDSLQVGVDRGRQDHLELVERALTEISSLADLSWKRQDDNPGNFIVAIMDRETIDFLDQPEFSNIGYFGNSIPKAAIEDGTCAFSLLGPKNRYSSAEKRDIIEGAVIFVSPELAGIDLEKCIYEEVAGAVGLVGDPEGDASLFSNGGYEIGEVGFTYSDRTLLLVEALYKISSGGVTDIDQFCASKLSDA